MPYSFTRPDGPVPPDLAVLAGLDYAVRLPLVLKELDQTGTIACMLGHPKIHRLTGEAPCPPTIILPLLRHTAEPDHTATREPETAVCLSKTNRA